jgi:hypothetical protein
LNVFLSLLCGLQDDEFVVHHQSKENKENHLRMVGQTFAYNFPLCCHVDERKKKKKKTLRTCWKCMGDSGDRAVTTVAV